MNNKYILYVDGGGTPTYVDGGGTPTVENYFSWKLFCKCSDDNLSLIAENLLQKTKDILILPSGCSATRLDGSGSNNIAELMALYYGICDLTDYIDLENNQVFIYHDSELCYRWIMTVLGKQDILRQQNILHATVKKQWLIVWVNTIVKIWHDNFVYCHIPRKIIKDVLGH